jgi:hypothetical protein
MMEVKREVKEDFTTRTARLNPSRGVMIHEACQLTSLRRPKSEPTTYDEEVHCGVVSYLRKQRLVASNDDPEGCPGYNAAWMDSLNAHPHSPHTHRAW